MDDTCSCLCKKDRTITTVCITPIKPNVAAPVKPLIERDDAEFSAFGNAGPLLLLRSDLEAPNRKVIGVDVRDPKPASWKTIVPEGKEAIETVALIGGRVVVQYLADVRSRLSLIGTDGKSQGDVELPGIGTVPGMGGREDTPEIFFAFSSPLFPTTVFNYDPVSKIKKAFEAPPSPVDTTQFETKQLFATSKDGTKVPFFVTARKGIT